MAWLPITSLGMVFVVSNFEGACTFPIRSPSRPKPQMLSRLKNFPPRRKIHQLLLYSVSGGRGPQKLPEI